MNPYTTLGIKPDASPDEIKKAYRKLARESHPDRGGDPETFKQIQSAYDQLTNPTPKHDPFADIFSSFFGGGFGGFGGRQQPKQQRGRDIQTEHTIDFLQAAYGCEATINIRRGDTCPVCQGVGATSMSDCSACGGHGMVSFRNGNMHVQQTCGHCSGKGKTIKEACSECSGDGIIKDTIPITIKLPQGIRDGTRVRLPGQGENKGSTPGDAYILVHVRPHSLFNRIEDDLVLTMPITYTQAVFGDSVEVPTLEGLEEIVIPPETKSGTEIKLIGMGLVDTQTGRRGDCVIKLEIDVTTHGKAKKLLMRYKKVEPVSEIRKKFKEEIEKLQE